METIIKEKEELQEISLEAYDTIISQERRTWEDRTDFIT